MRRVTVRFPFADLERWIELNYPDSHVARAQQKGDSDLATGRIAELLDMHSKNVYRWRTQGLSEQQADHLCCKLNIHPSLIWPDWWGPEASASHDVEVALG